VESCDFFSERISQERLVGLRQSIEVSRMWGAHTKELGVRARQVLQRPRVEGEEGLGRQQVEQEGGLGEGPG